MDTNSNYIATSAERIEDIVRPELKPEFEAQKNSGRLGTSGAAAPLVSLSLSVWASRMIALSSKCYFIEEPEDEKKKFSTKEMSKKQNEITWQRFKAALEGSKDMATNRGFRMLDGRMVNYEQQKLGLSAYYDKQLVLPDGIHTRPIEFHI